MDNEWIKEQIRFASSINNLLRLNDIDWSRQISFDELFEYYPDEFVDEDDGEEF